MAIRALVQVPARVARGEVVTVRASVLHPMETGHRADGSGGTVPRDIVRRLEARWGDEPVFAADLFPAVAANPYVAFPWRASPGGPLVLRWTGDRGFEHRETVVVEVA